jgi:hypothetical protein
VGFCFVLPLVLYPQNSTASFLAARPFFGDLPMKFIRAFAVAGCTLTALAARAHALVTVFDNLGSPPTVSSFGYATFGLIDGIRYDRGMQFTASASVYLSTLQLGIGQAFWDGTTVPGTAKVQLLTDNAGAPGTVLQTWTTSNQNGFAGIIETLPSATVTPLTSGKSYWLMLSDAPGSNLGGAWGFADDAHTGLTNVDFVNESTGVSTFNQLTRGYRALLNGNPWLPGDATLNAKVDLTDLAVVLNNFGKTTSLWTNGNFDGAAKIDLTDLNDVLNNFGKSATSGGAATTSALITPAPEPATLLLLPLGALALPYRRTRIKNSFRNP